MVSPKFQKSDKFQIVSDRISQLLEKGVKPWTKPWKSVGYQSLSGYYATAIHELGHWTGHETRLKRDLSGRFGTQSYAFEELIAELTAAFVLNEFNYSGELENHASYLNNWLSALKDDKKYFFKAASLASKASEFLLNDKAIQTA